MANNTYPNPQSFTLGDEDSGVFMLTPPEQGGPVWADVGYGAKGAVQTPRKVGTIVPIIGGYGFISEHSLVHSGFEPTLDALVEKILPTLDAVPSALRYPAKLTHCQDNPGKPGYYLVTFPDIPEAVTQVDSLDDLVVMAHDALDTAMDFYLEDNRPLPMPSQCTGGLWIPTSLGLLKYHALKKKGLVPY